LPPEARGEQAKVPSPVVPATGQAPSQGRNVVESTVVVTERWDRSAQVEIKTTEADLRNILHKHLDALGARDGWIGRLAITLPIGLALAAGIKHQGVEDILIGAFGASLLWLGMGVRTAMENWGHRGIDSIIDEFRPRPPAPTPATGRVGYWRGVGSALRSLFRALFRRPA